MCLSFDVQLVENARSVSSIGWLWKRCSLICDVCTCHESDVNIAILYIVLTK